MEEGLSVQGKAVLVAQRNDAAPSLCFNIAAGLESCTRVPMKSVFVDLPLGRREGCEDNGNPSLFFSFSF